MLSKYEPNVNAIITFLRLQRVKVNNTTVNETLQNHPEWPTFLCISDSFNKWNIPNGAGKIDVNKIDELPTPFIAYTYDKETPLAIVAKISGTTLHLYQKNYIKPVTESKEDFLKKWNGVYLIAEPNNNSGERNYELNRRKGFLNSLIPVAAIVALLIVSLLLLNTIVVKTGLSPSISSVAIYLQFFLLFAGIAVTTLLLWYEIDKSNPILQKVCTGIAKGNCNAILKGKHAKVFKWLSWSEVGFFYFTGGLLTLLFSSTSITNSIALVASLNILALPYTAFSVYYQWRVAKQWCVLCLAVQLILLLSSINVLANSFLFPFPLLSASYLTKVALLYLLPVLIWFAAKPHILRLQEAKNTKREYLRIKFNAEIFDTLLKKQKSINLPTNDLGIDLGNPAATNTLIKVCNPYCGPCAKAHSKIDELLKENENLKVKIIFTTPNEEGHVAVKPVRHLLAIAEEANEIKTQKALDDWYLAETKDYERFAEKHPMNGELLKQGNKIEVMEKWCKEMDIRFTPTFFINEYQLPDAYSIEDLQYFLLE